MWSAVSRQGVALWCFITSQSADPFNSTASLAKRSRPLFLRALLGLLLALCTLILAAPAKAEDYLDPEDAFQLSVAMASDTELHVHFAIAPDYYMYRDRFVFEAEPSSDWLGEPQFPPAKVIYDPTFDEDMATYRREVTVRLPIQSGSPLPLTLAITSQGCADAGLCYSPIVNTMTLTPTDAGYRVEGEWARDHVPAPLTEVVDSYTQAATPSLLSMNDTGLAQYLSEAGYWQVVGLSFLFGLLLSFTPCVLPMVPILLGIIAGRGPEAPALTRRRGLSLAAVYVLGVSVVYTLLGISAGLAGASLAMWLQNPWILSVFAALLVLLSLSMFDVYQLQVPVAWQSRLQQRLQTIPGGRYSGVFVMGMLSAFIVGPCVAAPLAGVLLFISQTGDVWVGGTALFALAWGSGVLLLVLGASCGSLMLKAGSWMNTVKQLFGVLLIATAWWLLYSVLPSVVLVLGWALLALWTALILGLRSPVPAQGANAFALLGRAVALLLSLWALVLVVGLASGGRSVIAPLKHLNMGGGSGAVAVESPTFMPVASVQELDALLAQTDRPVMLDFYADWCVSCIEMENFTFTDPTVARQMSAMLLVQADVTANTPQHRELLQRFKLFGPPGIIFFDANGKEITQQRVVGFQSADRFSKVLEAVFNAG